MHPPPNTRQRPAGGPGEVQNDALASEPHPTQRVRGSVVSACRSISDTGLLVTVAQLRALHASLSAAEVSADRSQRLAVVSSMLGRHIESTGELSRREAASLIEVLHREKST